MNDASIIIQRPAPSATHLFLLFHGVGAVPESMVPVGEQLARAFPAAMVVSVASPFASDISAGRQWFSVVGVTEDNRGARVADVMPLFVETVCTDEELVDANVRESKLSMPDYAGVDAEAAVRDFRARIAHYERAYEPLTEESRSFVRLIDVGRRVEMNRVEGGLATQIVSYLTNLHVTPRPLVFTRHGQSEYNALHRIGGDSGLTARGKAFAEANARMAVSP